MKNKYVYVMFNSMSSLYIYHCPNFKLKRGYLVEVETGGSTSEAVVFAIKNHNESELPLLKKDIKNVKKVVNRKIKFNLNSLKRRTKTPLSQRIKWSWGFKKTKNRNSVCFTYKKNNKISVFYFKEDNSYIIDLYVAYMSFSGIYCVGRSECEMKLHELKKHIKQYVNNRTSKEHFMQEIEKMA